MSNANSQITNSGISTSGLIGVVFITLKLCNVITWSWWWVTVPFWGPPALVLAFLGIGLIGALLFIGIGALIAYCTSK